MAVLPMPSLIKPHLPHILPFSQTRLALPRRKPSHVVVSAAAAATIGTKSLKTNPTQTPKQLGFLSLGPIGSKADQIFFKDQYMNVDEGAVRESDVAIADHQRGGVRMVMERLERVGERMREMELEKLKGRMRGNLMSQEENELVEMMSREIVASFLEKPIQFLNSSDGKLEDKLRDLDFFVGIREESCFINGETSIHV